MNPRICSVTETRKIQNRTTQHEWTKTMDVVYLKVNVHGTKRSKNYVWLKYRVEKLATNFSTFQKFVDGNVVVRVSRISASASRITSARVWETAASKGRKYPRNTREWRWTKLYANSNRIYFLKLRNEQRNMNLSQPAGHRCKSYSFLLSL